MPSRKQKEFDEWKAGLDARHAEWARQAAELDAKISAELDAKYPASEGWRGKGRQPRIRALNFKQVPEFYGDGI